jgi:hypothetical protein
MNSIRERIGFLFLLCFLLVLLLGRARATLHSEERSAEVKSSARFGSLLIKVMILLVFPVVQLLTVGAYGWASPPPSWSGSRTSGLLTMSCSRRTAILTTIATSSTLFVSSSSASAVAASIMGENDQRSQLVSRMERGLAQLESLLGNWSDITTDCTYADVDRSLLEDKNKAKLLKEATKWALFDKSNSVMSCKRVGDPVRKALGVSREQSADNPLYKVGD